MKKGSHHFDKTGVVFMAVGDIILGRKVYEKIELNCPEYPFKYVANTLREAHLVYGNLECPISIRGERTKRKPIEDPVFRAAPIVVSGLKYSGFNILNLANNHTLDFGGDALLDTLEILDNNNIKRVGAGKDEKEAREPLIIEINGLRISFISYPAIAPDFFHSERVLLYDLKKNKHKADIIIVSLHTGVEYANYPTLSIINFARKCVEFGANLVLGHHPHVLQGIEYYKHGVIVYSLGNFVSDQSDLETKKEDFSRTLFSRYPKFQSKYPEFRLSLDDKRDSESLIFRCNIEMNGVKNIELLPVRINSNFQPQLLTGEEKEAILRKINILSDGIVNDAIAIKRVEELRNQFKIDSIKNNLFQHFIYFVKNIYRIRLKHIRFVINVLKRYIGVDNQ